MSHFNQYLRFFPFQQQLVNSICVEHRTKCDKSIFPQKSSIYVASTLKIPNHFQLIIVFDNRSLIIIISELAKQ